MEFSEWLESQYRPYLSAYLSQGWKSDRHYIHSIDLQPEAMQVRVDVLASYYPADSYYFSTVHAIPLIYQFVILYSCWENQWSKKPGDVYLRRLNIETPRMIHDQENICFEFTLEAKRSTAQWLYYSMNFQIGDRQTPQAFKGNLHYAVPLLDHSLAHVPAGPSPS